MNRWRMKWPLILVQTWGSDMGTKRQSQIFLSEVVLDEHPRLTLSELCQARGLNAETVIEMVNEGVLEVRGSSPSEWTFTSDSLC